jgi:bifunctional non-homologous end joining protein LigD
MVPGADDFDRGREAGKLEFVLHGEKLNGRFALVRMGGNRGKQNWLLIKMRDEFMRQSGNGKPARTPRRPTRTAPSPTPREHESSPSPIEVTNGDKIWFPEDGITKGDVFNYYAECADRLIPFLRNRPMTLERLPDGIGEGKPHFWQKHAPAHYPSWIPRVNLPTERGKAVDYVLVNDKETLLYLVNQGTLTFHPWLSRVDHPDHPDFVLFDLDPGGATFANAATVARRLHEILEEEGLSSVPKTSGKTGIHVLVAWEKDGDFDKARAWARSIADRVVAETPDSATTEIRKTGRGKRVYVDTLQNAEGHHAVPPYVVRPVAGAPVSMPLEWNELTGKLRPGHFTIKTALRRLTRQMRDPMADLLNSFR